MVPLVKRSADTLVELFGEKADTGESIDILKYVGVALSCILLNWIWVGHFPDCTIYRNYLANIMHVYVNRNLIFFDLGCMVHSLWSRCWPLPLVVWWMFRKGRQMKWLKLSANSSNLQKGNYFCSAFFCSVSFTCGKYAPAWAPALPPVAGIQFCVALQLLYIV